VQSRARLAGVRRAITLTVVSAIAITFPAPNAQAASDPLAAAQAKITSAQEAADQAAAAYDATEAHYYQLKDDAFVARKAVAALRANQRHLVAIVQERAVELYVRAGSPDLDVFRTNANILDASRRVTLAAIANAGDDVAIGRLRAATEDLGVKEASLRSQLADVHRSLGDLESQQQDLQQAVADAQRAEAQLRAQLERERRLSEYAALVRRSQDAARSAVPSNGGSSSGDRGGAPGQIIGSGSWICPVQGGVSFTDTFGAPRGNGRTHKGVDMFAATGTPLVAVVSGSVFFQSDTLGGLAAYVRGNDGNTYYYAHLNDYVGGGRSVTGGEVIGHVGNTGDASDGPSHLHFEIRPGGPNGLAIDPYPTVRAHC
jgi:peptidoglycan LD-endopeptidase LytH